MVAYGALLRDGLLAVPAHGWINLHFSLLPAWRGAAPVQAAIAAGDAVTGATTFLIERSLDSGPVYGVVTETIRPTDTAGDLLGRLSVSGAALLEATLDGIADGIADRGAATGGRRHRRARRSPSTRRRIRWDLPAHVVERRIRAVTPQPGAWTMIGDLRFKLGPVTVQTDAPEAVGAGRDSCRPRRCPGGHRVAAGDARPDPAAGQETDDRRRLGARCPAGTTVNARNDRPGHGDRPPGRKATRPGPPGGVRRSAGGLRARRLREPGAARACCASAASTAATRLSPSS